MTLKHQVIQWINSDQDHQQGLYLLKQWQPGHSLLSPSDSRPAPASLLQVLSRGLLSDAFDVVSITPHHPPEQSAKHHPENDNTETVEEVEAPGLSIAARLEFDRSDLIKGRAVLENKLRSATSDTARKSILDEISALQKRLVTISNQIKQANNGDKVDLLQDQSIITDDFFTYIPSDQLEIIQKIPLVRSRLSKARGKLKKLEETPGKDTPDYNECVDLINKLVTLKTTLEQSRKKEHA